MARQGLIVIIRGPMGAGKPTLMNGLARARGRGFWVLDTDQANAPQPGDPYGEHLDDEWSLEVELLAIHSKIVLGRGLNLILDPGIFLTSKEVDRFLRKVGRSRRDRRVILIRLAVEQEEAVRRKVSVRPDYVRSSHLGWQPSAIAGEVEVVTTGLSPAAVLRAAKRAIRERLAARGWWVYAPHLGNRFPDPIWPRTEVLTSVWPERLLMTTETLGAGAKGAMSPATAGWRRTAKTFVPGREPNQRFYEDAVAPSLGFVKPQWTNL